MDPVGVSKISCGNFTDDTSDSDYILLPPKRKLGIDSRLRKKLAAALVTRYSPDDPQMKILMTTTSKYIPESIHQWGQPQIRDGGDWFKCRALLKGQGHARDCTYVKVSMSHPPSPSRISQLIVGP
jgi:hypothetical protein